MDSPGPREDPPIEADRQTSQRPQRWNLVYLAVLAHLALWIAVLALFSRFFGSNT